MSLNDIAAKTLGSANSYAVFTEQFDSSLLNPMPRKLGRDDWNISGNEFGVGYDVWHCHESTFLLDNGVPVAGTLKFVYSADTEFMVESKSAKLYLNSFDMCKMGNTLSNAIRRYELQVEKDLSECVKGEVKCRFYTASEFYFQSKQDLLQNSKQLESCFDIEKTMISDYRSEENHIIIDNQEYIGSYYTNVLRSRCRHTKQKDTGLALIDFNSSISVNPESLFKQIVSLREVNEFHELCSEKLFAEIMKEYDGELAVTLLYSRRGSLDINPVRATSLDMIDPYLIDIDLLTQKVQGQ